MKRIKKYMRQNMRASKGFTLVELLVSIALFAVVVSLVTGVFVSAVRTQREIVALVSANDNAESALEQIAREMRTGFGFPLVAFSSQGTPSASLTFFNAQAQSVTYGWNQTDKTIEKSVNGGASLPITGRNVEVRNFMFIQNAGPTSITLPTRITIVVEVAPTLPVVSENTTKLQVTISPR